MADRFRLVGAMDTIDGLPEIERARAQGVAWTAGHEPRQIGLAFNHFRRRPPVRPLLLARNALQAGPLEAFAAHADAVAKGPVVPLQHVKETLLRVDDDRTAASLPRKKTSCFSKAPVSCSSSGDG